MVYDDGVAVDMKPVGFIASQHDFASGRAFDRGASGNGDRDKRHPHPKWVRICLTS